MNLKPCPACGKMQTTKSVTKNGKNWGFLWLTSRCCGSTFLIGPGLSAQEYAAIAKGESDETLQKPKNRR